MILVEVLIEHAVSALNRPFTYFYDGKKRIEKGFRVKVRFNNQELVGYVLSIEQTTKSVEEIEQERSISISEIEDVIDVEPILNEELLVLANQISEYYLAPLISVLQAMLPKTLSPKSSALKGPKIAYDSYVVIKKYDEENLTSKQIELLRLINQEKKVLKKDIKSISVLEKLISYGLVDIVKEEKRRFVVPKYKFSENPKLTIDQQKVVDEFNSSSDQVYLLQGVTGSGKSEVYLSLSEQVLKQGKSVLMLVPEISLTPMMMEYFISRFKNQVAILHSELTPAEKYDEYRKTAKGEFQVVVGARSAIFAPLSNIGLIILDEEHVESYKQDNVPYYHAREVAIMRAKLTGAKVILGSATPSLESRAKAQNHLYHLLTLDKRINNQELPIPQIVNMLDYRNIDSTSYIFSHQLRKAMRETLDKKEQMILLINRRGHSTSVTCRSCGELLRCPTCGIPLTYHKQDNMLKCHHCDYVEVMVDKCPHCSGTKFLKTGFGTERIEEEVNRLFPDARTVRLDSDSGKVRTRISKIIEQFKNKEADVLIGTQMVAKGHDFPDVTLVGIVLADIGLSMPSFRSSERVFQLITQAVGRSGRADKKGQAIIQTYMPSHYAIQIAAEQNYEKFYLKEKAQRKLLNYPPYYFLASILVAGKDEQLVIEGAYFVIDKLNKLLQDKGIVLGPVTPYIPYENNTYTRSVLIKFKDMNFVREEIKKITTSYINKSRINIKVNIDPYDF